MATLVLNKTSFFHRQLHSAFMLVVKTVRLALTQVAHQRAIRELNHLSDRQLEDIGITRGDITTVVRG